jgi:hypothetical protein
VELTRPSLFRNLAQLVRPLRGMIIWIIKCLRTLGIVVLTTAVLALAVAFGTAITAWSQWDEFEQRVE